MTVLFEFIINSKYASTALTGQMVTVLKTIEKFQRSDPEDITNVVNTVSTSLHSTFNMFTNIEVMCHQLIRIDALRILLHFKLPYRIIVIIYSNKMHN